MKIYIGADHRGFEGRKEVIAYLKKGGYDVEDDSGEQLNPDDDFPVFAGRVAQNVLSGPNDSRGILICGSGQGVCMAANRFKGIRAALAANEESVRAARNDDDANVLCLPAEDVEADNYRDSLEAFLKTPFAAAPRFIRRIKEMDNL